MLKSACIRARPPQLMRALARWLCAVCSLKMLLPFLVCLSWFASSTPRCSEAFATVVSPEYIHGAVQLAAGIQKFWHVPRAFTFLVTSDFPQLDSWRTLLRKMCVQLVAVENIENPYRASQKRFDGNSSVFLKLQAFNLTRYSRVLLIDSDQLVLRSYDTLFDYSPFAAGPETAASSKLFASGTMLIEPNTEVFSDMMSKLGRIPSLDGADMGFLNSYFSKTWREAKSAKGSRHFIPWYKVAYRRTLLHDPKLWRSKWRYMSGVDCSGSLSEKPWADSWYIDAKYRSLYSLWWSNYAEITGVRNDESIENRRVSYEQLHLALENMTAKHCQCLGRSADFHAQALWRFT